MGYWLNGQWVEDNAPTPDLGATPAAPAAPAATYAPYVTPTQRQHQARSQMQAGGLGEGQINVALHAAAVNYANRQLAKYRRVAGALGPEFLNMLGGDPLHAYAAASAAFTTAARGHGFQDPRVYLAQLLQHRPGPGGVQAP